MKDYKEFVPDVHYELIPINQLVSNQDYQRNLSMIHVRKTAEQFNLYQINPVKVSRRDGVNFVFNGQHTIETVALVSGSRETPVWCMIYDDMDYRVEADVFANQQKCVKPLSPVVRADHRQGQGAGRHLCGILIGTHIQELRVPRPGPVPALVRRHLGRGSQLALFRYLERDSQAGDRLWG